MKNIWVTIKGQSAPSFLHDFAHDIDCIFREHSKEYVEECCLKGIWIKPCCKNSPISGNKHEV